MKNSSWTFRSLEYVTAALSSKRWAPITQCHGVMSIRAKFILAVGYERTNYMSQVPVTYSWFFRILH